MKYHVYSSNHWREDPDGLIQQYPCLNNYNFRIEGIQTPRTYHINDENGQTIKQIKYSIKRLGYIDIESLEQLMQLQADVNKPLIIDIDDYGPEILIYDGYIE